MLGFGILACCKKIESITMTSEKDKSIIQKVREYLGSPTEDAWELFKILRKKRSGLHPDLFSDKDAKECAEEDFKKANGLLKELRFYIEQQHAANLPVLCEEKNEVAEFFHMKIVDDKDAEIERLNSQIFCLNHQISIEKRCNEELLQKIEELSKKNVNDIHEEIKSIYTPRKAWTNIGLVAILTSLLATFPVVSEFLTSIEADSKLILAALQVISVVTIFNWLRSWLINKIVEKIEYEVLNSEDINTTLKVSERTTRYRKDFVFYEHNITSYLKSRFNLAARCVLFGGLNKTIKILTEDIILQLDRKKLIKNSDAEGLNKLFVVNSPSDYATDNVPFD